MSKAVTLSADEARLILKRLPISLVKELGEQVGNLATQRKKKTSIIEEMNANLNGALPIAPIASLDLKNIAGRPSQRVWLRFTAERPASSYLDPRSIAAALTADLAPLFDTHVSALLDAGVLWLRVFLREPTLADGRGRSSVVYCALRPGVEACVVNGPTQAVRRTATQAVGRILRMGALHPSTLSTRAPESFLVAAAARKRVRADGAYHAQVVDDAPTAKSLRAAAGSSLGHGRHAVKPRSLHRAQAAVEANAGARGGVVISEDAAARVGRVIEGEAAVGFCAAPARSSAEVDVSGPVDVQGEAMELGCSVRFDGTNVVEGIRAMIEEGHTDTPLPPRLLEITRL